MPQTMYLDRPAHTIENDVLAVTVTIEGGHIASILHKATGVNPLWTPPWRSIDPSTYDHQRHSEYGNDSESKLLAGILGHNLCLDLFGAPSPEEAAAGMTVHGEASTARYEIQSSALEMVARCQLPSAQLEFHRQIRLRPGDSNLYIDETVENLSPLDRPIAWTQHVTLGPPFLEKGKTVFRASATRGRTLDGRDFEWPFLADPSGHREDLQTYTAADTLSRFTTQLMDPHREQAFFAAWSPASKLLFSYVWRRSDFPWLGIWEENHARTNPPWNGQTLTRGMEFGASPFPESRRQMIDRNTLWGTPCYRWVPAKSKVTVEYKASLRTSEGVGM